MNSLKPKRQISCYEQRIALQHDMANVLSTLNLRLYAIKRQQLLNDNESKVFEQCFERLAALLEQWKTLEQPRDQRVADYPVE